ncbi:sortase [Mechercharimyces sp. CAU 1602]|uniref:sortase n=1 Tax=Mechercharimyces sp. CAU 1602 TaxID=2973933 RepID=UPI002162CDD7|nr:sortase [Mechercharimyces sp. CAU 1602]MCS1352770.1 sortase [Mechercharimyces sp. CAU 1602]
MRAVLGLIGCALLIGGLYLFLSNGLSFWEQYQVAEVDVEAARKVDQNWDDRKLLPVIKGEDQQMNPLRGEQIGKLIIPRVGYNLPIVEGTSDADLKKGVGRYIGEGMVFPGEQGHVSLAGHNNTVFSELGELENGDRITIKMNSKQFVYQVHKTYIVDADDTNVLVPTEDATLTLVTCYPFGLLSEAKERYIIEAKLIEAK